MVHTMWELNLCCFPSFCQLYVWVSYAKLHFFLWEPFTGAFFNGRKVTYKQINTFCQMEKTECPIVKFSYRSLILHNFSNLLIGQLCVGGKSTRKEKKTRAYNNKMFNTKHFISLFCTCYIVKVCLAVVRKLNTCLQRIQHWKEKRKLLFILFISKCTTSLSRNKIQLTKLYVYARNIDAYTSKIEWPCFGLWNIIEDWILSRLRQVLSRDRCFFAR